MRFVLTADQVALRDAVRELLEQECSADVVREAWTESMPRAEAVWEKLTRMGLFGAAVPQESGGLGLDLTDVVPVLMEVGYAAVPLPVAETMAVAAPLLAECGHHRLPEVLDGQTLVSLAEPGGLVPYGRHAEAALVVEHDQIRLVQPCHGPAEAAIDGSRGLVRADVSAGEVVTTRTELVRLTRDRSDAARAAQLVGLGRRMLDLTRAYVVDRTQFGVPVGSFQAVKHRLADALLRMEFAAPAVLAAAWELSQRTATASRAVSVASLLAVEAATEMAKAAIQCHGAIGYTVEYDLHLYAKRAWALAAGCRTDEHLDRLARALDLSDNSGA